MHFHLAEVTTFAGATCADTRALCAKTRSAVYRGMTSFIRSLGAVQGCSLAFGSEPKDTKSLRKSNYSLILLEGHKCIAKPVSQELLHTTGNYISDKFERQ